MRAATSTHQRWLAISLFLFATAAFVVLATGPAASAAKLPAAPAPAGLHAGYSEPPPGEPGFQCFSLGEGASPNATVKLETSNFGRDKVIVRKSNLACESATRYPTGTDDARAPENPQVMQCFKTARGRDVNREVVLTSEIGRTTATARKAKFMCENAAKIRPLRGVSGVDVEQAWQCFELVDASATPSTTATVVTDNWGAVTGGIGRAAFLCEEALKTRQGWAPFGEETGVAYLCSDFGGPLLGQPAILQTRNFGNDGVLFGTSAMWCERVQKTLGPTTILLPAGRTATLAGTELEGCNSLAYGYQVNSGPLQQLGQTIAACTTVPFPDTVFGPFQGDVEIRMFLRDDTCGRTYFSDGNHARVAGHVPELEVAIRDAGGNCEIADEASVPPSQAAGNLRLRVLIN